MCTISYCWYILGTVGDPCTDRLNRLFFYLTFYFFIFYLFISRCVILDLLDVFTDTSIYIYLERLAFFTFNLFTVIQLLFWSINIKIQGVHNFSFLTDLAPWSSKWLNLNCLHSNRKLTARSTNGTTNCSCASCQSSGLASTKGAICAH